MDVKAYSSLNPNLWLTFKNQADERVGGKKRVDVHYDVRPVTMSVYARHVVGSRLLTICWGSASFFSVEYSIQKTHDNTPWVEWRNKTTAKLEIKHKAKQGLSSWQNDTN